MKKVNPQTLKILRHRFDEQITEADILAWLYNFQEEDWESALILLNQVSYYSGVRCATVLEDGLKRILNKSKNIPMVFFPIGGVGKSGGVMAYTIKKLMGRFSHVSWQFVDIDFKFKKIPYTIILLDDFIGSGKSTSDLYDSIYPKFPKGSKCYCLCVAYMQQGGSKLEDNGLTIYGQKHFPAFVRRHSVFGYPPKIKRIRSFAEKYGNLLYPKKTYTPGMKLYIGPLGYANSQALVCFDHTTPNNTLPILWEGKKRLDNGTRWIPLFPRRLFDRTRRDESYERMKYKWISIARKISNGKINYPFNDYKKSTILQLGLLHYKLLRKSDAEICTYLEITTCNLSTLYEEAKENGLLDNMNMLTERGKYIYEDIRRTEFSAQPLLMEDQYNMQEIVYIPNEFLGLSKS